MCTNERNFTNNYDSKFIGKTVQAEVAKRAEQYAETLPPVENTVDNLIGILSADKEKSEDLSQLITQTLQTGNTNSEKDKEKVLATDVLMAAILKKSGHDSV